MRGSYMWEEGEGLPARHPQVPELWGQAPGTGRQVQGQGQRHRHGKGHEAGTPAEATGATKGHRRGKKLGDTGTAGLGTRFEHLGNTCSGMGRGCNGDLRSGSKWHRPTRSRLMATTPGTRKLLALQHNCARGGQVLEAVLETAVRMEVDLVLI